MNTPAFLPAGQQACAAPVITRTTRRGVALPGLGTARTA